MTKQKQHKEQLSTFMDAEQLETETSQIVTHLLNNLEYKERYIRLQYAQDALNHRPLIDIRAELSQALEPLETHFVDEAVCLQTVQTIKAVQITDTKDIRQISWFKSLNRQKIMTGASIAASVMFATLLGLEFINSPYTQVSPDITSNKTIHLTNPHSDSKQNKVFFDPSLVAELPSVLVSYPVNIFQWKEMETEVSQQVMKPAMIQTVTSKQVFNND